MKKLLAIFLIVAITGDSVRASELLKIPNLLRHYKEHKALHPGDSALAFLSKHYIVNTTPESDKDKSSDSSLPFKSPQDAQGHLASCIFIENIIQFEPGTCNQSFLPLKENYILASSFDIWQPPKVN